MEELELLPYGQHNGEEDKSPYPRPSLGSRVGGVEILQRDYDASTRSLAVQDLWLPQKELPARRAGTLAPCLAGVEGWGQERLLEGKKESGKKGEWRHMGVVEGTAWGHGTELPR